VSPIRRLDHVAIAVRDTQRALETFRDVFGLKVVHQEQLTSPPVQLTYLDCGNALLQLVEPLAADSPLARLIEERGEGFNHVCFAVDDVLADAASLAVTPGDDGVVRGEGRGRVSAFVPGPSRHGVLFECTEFRPEDAGRGGVRGEDDNHGADRHAPSPPSVTDC
jgi:methylmalonyl-CoA/ethylmalonyl-CoA epimerase